MASHAELPNPPLSSPALAQNPPAAQRPARPSYVKPAWNALAHPALPRACIIGAGSSGIAACKVFQDAAIPWDCFEASSDIGGMWQFGNAQSASAYRSLHINTSRRTMEYSDFPMPEDYPDFPHHTLILDYFRSYVDHFCFRHRITFNTRVERCERQADGTWSVQLSNGERRRYDAVVVANGHHWDPLFPEPRFAGQFDGIELHAHHYVDETNPHDLRDKCVVIVGMGNSAMDIACELGRKGVGRRVMLSIRTPNHVVPKYLKGGRVLDFWSRHPAEPPGLTEQVLRAAMPKRLLNWLYTRLVEETVGRPEQYGLPRPAHRLTESHPTISSEIHYRLGAGDVIPKPNIRELRGRELLFEDGSVEPVDAIIYATGYRISFPFLEQSVISAKDNDIALYKRIIDPRHPDLLFLALVQPLCAMMPIAEQQAIFMARYLRGEYHLPARDAMARDMREEHERTKAGYVRSKRHTIQIDCQAYCDDLRAELGRGAERARHAEFMLPIEPRAAAAAT
jgi:cation diffusion facilitator CzcD-associated flavoprotein CzcO